MKYLSLIPILLMIFQINKSSAQIIGKNCYEHNIQKGTIAFDKGDYKKAINSYIIARWCKKIVPKGEEKIRQKVKSNQEVDSLINHTLTIWVNFLKQQKKEIDSLYLLTLAQKDTVAQERDAALEMEERARKNWSLAENRLLIINSIRFAESARKDIEERAYDQALAKAFHAYDTLMKTKTYLPLIVKKVLGEAIFTKFHKSPSFNHQGKITDIIFSKSGDHFLLKGQDALLSHWKLKEDSISYIESIFPMSKIDLLKEKQPIADQILTASLSDTGSQITISYKLGKPILQKTNSSKIILENTNHETILQLKHLPDNRFLSISREGNLCLWTANGQSRTVLANDENPFIELQLSTDRQYAIARTMKSLYYWNTTLSNTLSPIVLTDTTLLYTAELSPDGKKIIASFSNKQIQLWEDNQWDKLITDYSSEASFALCFAPDNRQFLVGSNDGNIQHWSKNGEIWNLDFFPLHNGPVDRLLFNPKSTAFLSAGLDTSLFIVFPSKSPIKIRQHADLITSMSFSPASDSLFLTTSKDGTAKLWEMDGNVLMDIQSIHQDKVSTAVFAKQGHFILLGTEKGSITFVPTSEYIYQKINNKNIQIKDINELIRRHFNQSSGINQ